MLLITITITIILLTFILNKLFNKYNYWSKRGVPNPKPKPFLGNLKRLLFQQETPVDFLAKIYKQYKNDPYVGIYKIGQPALFLRDPELIKQVLIKEFNHFQYNDLFVKKTELFGQNPFLLNGNEWKVRRSQITPTLTPVKLKAMFEIMSEISNDLVSYIENNALEKEDIEGKQLSSRFMTENYTSCIFGIEGRSFENTNCKDSLFELGNQVSNTPSWSRFKKFCLYIKPGWARIFRHNYFTKEIHWYHINTVKETLKYRSSNNVNVQNDFFGHFLQKQASSKESIEELLAIHAATVYVDGVETAALTMAFVLYELSKDSAIQSKLRTELNEMLQKSESNKPTYESLMSLEYLNNVISEILRLHPPLPFMNKICTKLFTFPQTKLNTRELTIEVGTPIIVPIRDLHYDAQFYPNPNKFNPDRFGEGSKLENPKCTYMPFGEGPRVCIGRKYAEMELKLGIARIVSNFEIRMSKKTTEPLTYEREFFLDPVGGLWIKLYKL